MSKHSLINLNEIFPETVEQFFTPWNEWFRRNGLFNRTTVPAMNISDEKDHYKVTVAAPGLRKADFDIKVENNVLTISGTSEKEKEDEKEKFRRREYSYSSFSRSLTLPVDTDADSIEASYDGGILTLDIPKDHDEEPPAEKKIEVK
jgi:HSP20 family protein